MQSFPSPCGNRLFKSFKNFAVEVVFANFPFRCTLSGFAYYLHFIQLFWLNFALKQLQFAAKDRAIRFTLWHGQSRWMNGLILGCKIGTSFSTQHFFFVCTRHIEMYWGRICCIFLNGKCLAHFSQSCREDRLICFAFQEFHSCFALQ